ncbi:MAG: RNA polymerase sigma-70 factor (ECF subfamily) [Flavobacteriales bacterium]|jgi:RNA polymerase sigma-70 factor (ECF subfamily)
MTGKSTVAMTSSPTPSASDSAIMVAVQSGDRSALAMLYDRYQHQLLSIGLRALGGQAEAEDVLHDVFVEAWQRAGQYERARGTVRTWLLMRMRSRCLDRRKSAAISRRETLDEPDAIAATNNGATMSRHLDASKVAAAAHGLDPALRTVVEMSYFRGLSSSEMATELGIPAGTVKSRMRAALEQLRSSFSEEDRQ